MLRRTLASTSSSSLYACLFNSGVMDRLAESGSVPQRSIRRRIRPPRQAPRHWWRRSVTPAASK